MLLGTTVQSFLVGDYQKKDGFCLISWKLFFHSSYKMVEGYMWLKILVNILGVLDYHIEGKACYRLLVKEVQRG
ncbi:hypothetical protein NDU88_005210 [Pleurodeles waltl]|uniref:Uncharacterized protein n=1 Tax=Pleurodeles waltl TaxID=8319 RepID=A0AAV7MVL9_PLEWA|nr:hypothetical protein NDU88_005210 [Pleurodeles waltl]